MEKLKKIFLVDDDEATNFVHEFQLKSANVCEKICVFENGKLAFEDISNNPEENLFDILFLDINMPIMNGWEFLDAFKNLQEQYNHLRFGKIVVVTTSINPDDRAKAEQHSAVARFETKPISKEKFVAIATDLCHQS